MYDYKGSINAVSLNLKESFILLQALKSIPELLAKQ